MRVIAGSARGIKLKTIPEMTTRPTVDRVKENMFNIIQHDIPGAVVADFFSGSGSLCIESLSRGASFAYFADKNPKCVEIIKDNLSACSMKDNFKIMNMEYDKFASSLSKSGVQLDIIFLDPPHRSGFGQDSIELINKMQLLREDGIIVVEHHKDEAYNDKYEGLVKFKTKKYGITALSFYRHEGETI